MIHRGMRLLHTNFIDVMKQKEFDGFLDGFHLREVNKGAILCHPDSDTDAMFVVVSGRLRVYLSCEGREFTLTLLEQGAAFTTQTRAIIEASSDAEVMVADMATFQTKLAHYPTMAFIMLGIMGEALDNSLGTIEGLVFRDVRQRLAEVLTDAADERGIPADGGVEIALGLNTEKLGFLIGASRQTTSQLINDFIRENLIEKTGNRSFLLKDVARLKALSGGAAEGF
ncbi:MAG: Crp/Fnr family transcriptional regulator [Caulobacteraceae bacterium]|nr:Crp/Fnr family transcriptional regulator [Caulobacteraceae bacterium]